MNNSIISYMDSKIGAGKAVEFFEQSFQPITNPVFTRVELIATFTAVCKKEFGECYREQLLWEYFTDSKCATLAQFLNGLQLRFEKYAIDEYTKLFIELDTDSKVYNINELDEIQCNKYDQSTPWVFETARTQQLFSHEQYALEQQKDYRSRLIDTKYSNNGS